MPPVLYRLKPAARHLPHKGFSPGEPLHIPHLALDDTAATRLGRAKELLKPLVRSKIFWQSWHTHTMPQED